jgi:hypothetical protein
MDTQSITPNTPSWDIVLQVAVDGGNLTKIPLGHAYRKKADAEKALAEIRDRLPDLACACVVKMPRRGFFVAEGVAL